MLLSYNYTFKQTKLSIPFKCSLGRNTDYYRHSDLLAWQRIQHHWNDVDSLLIVSLSFHWRYLFACVDNHSGRNVTNGRTKHTKALGVPECICTSNAGFFHFRYTWLPLLVFFFIDSRLRTIKASSCAIKIANTNDKVNVIRSKHSIDL